MWVCEKDETQPYCQYVCTALSCLLLAIWWFLILAIFFFNLSWKITCGWICSRMKIVSWLKFLFLFSAGWHPASYDRGWSQSCIWLLWTLQPRLWHSPQWFPAGPGAGGGGQPTREGGGDTTKNESRVNFLSGGIEELHSNLYCSYSWLADVSCKTTVVRFYLHNESVCPHI